MKTLNQAYSRLSARRRYEVWFVRLGLADGSGAWWLRYLLMNPGRGGCGGNNLAQPVQVWATWFRRDAKPQTFIQGFPLQDFQLSAKGQSPFHFGTGKNTIGENACHGVLKVDGHEISWDLRYRSTFHVTLSDRGWIGFSRTAHSDAVFSGSITVDGRHLQGEPLGFGLQGHNCGYRHRGFWTWAHACFPQPGAGTSTLEALIYDMPFGLMFRRAVLWHEGKSYIFRDLKESTRDRESLRWSFHCRAPDGLELAAAYDGGRAIHRLPYLRTDCSGSFEVVNNSAARATVQFGGQRQPLKKLETDNGAVLEIGGQG